MHLDIMHVSQKYHVILASYESSTDVKVGLSGILSYFALNSLKIVLVTEISLYSLKRTAAFFLYDIAFQEFSVFVYQ